MIGRRAAAVFADVDDETFFAGADRVEFFFELVKARRVHAADVQVPELVVTELVHRRTIRQEPRLVEQLPRLRVTDRAEANLAFLAIRAADLQTEFAVERTVQDRRQIGLRINGGAVDAQNHFARRERRLLFRGRSGGKNVADFQTRPAMRRIEAYAAE